MKIECFLLSEFMKHGEETDKQPYPLFVPANCSAEKLFGECETTSAMYAEEWHDERDQSIVIVRPLDDTKLLPGWITDDELGPHLVFAVDRVTSFVGNSTTLAAAKELVTE